MATMTIDEIQLPTDFSVVTDEQLDELDEVARAAADPIVKKYNEGDPLSDDELNTLERLSGVVAGVGEQRDERAKAAEQTADKTGRAGKAAAAFGQPAASTPPSEGTPPAEPTKDDKDGGDKVTAPGVGAVAAAAGNQPQTTGPNVGTGETRQSYTKALAANGAAGRRPGEEFDDLAGMAKTMEDSMAAFGDLGPGAFHRTNVIQLRREYPAELSITKEDTLTQAWAKLDAAAKDPGLATLTAAAGWCAPSEILYDLFELEDGNDGQLDLPELQIHRGGVQVTPGPDFSAIFGGAGYWHQTEAQVVAATSKPTMVVPCPSFTDNRLEVEGVQITGAFLQDRGYPEVVERFIRGAMVAHKRKLNIFAINKVANGSTVFDYTNAANLPVTTTESKDLTALSRLLAVAGIQIMDYRYKYRMPFAATLECVLPFWVIESIRADVQRRMGVDRDDAFSLAQSQIEEWFALRNARVQWVYDWQEALNSTGSPNTATTVGQSAGVYTLPTTLYMLLYAAGTWVRGVADVIRLDTVYDSTNLALNQYVRLFTEDGIQVIKRGFESRMVKMTIDPSGTTSATTNMVTG
jgi:biotin carboxyl carrier protein